MSVRPYELFRFTREGETHTPVRHTTCVRAPALAEISHFRQDFGTHRVGTVSFDDRATTECSRTMRHERLRATLRLPRTLAFARR